MELLAFLKGLEDELGRLPSFRWGPRSIDIDILFYDALVLNLEHLSIPHPRLHERAFVLVPLQELAPKLRHPVLHQTVRELAALLPQSGIERASEQW
jgi:2-amino-4-hydroxy-6-hydroxymethyldihydropteridine diphosphokinase